MFVISAPSGTGKTTLLERLLASAPDLAFSVSHTTRAPRPGEVDGRAYHFVSRAAFQDLIARGRFLEWAEVYGELYGTSRDEVEGRRAQGVDVLLDVDAQGARSVKHAIPDAVLILILPPSWQVLRQRLEARGTETPERLDRRLKLAREQLDSFELYEYAVVNDVLDEAAATLCDVVSLLRGGRAEAESLERSRLAQHREHIARLLASHA